MKSRTRSHTGFVMKFAALFAFWFCAACVLCDNDTHSNETADLDLIVVTVATEEQDGFRLFMRSARKYGYNVKVFGMGEEWKGGSMSSGEGGGQKVNLLKQGLKKYKNMNNLLIMFTDSYDVVLTEGPEVLIEKFKKFDARVVFGAELSIWPDATLKDKYPMVKENEKRFLNSGGIIGYAKDIIEIVEYRQIGDTEDDQLYYTRIFLDRVLRHEWNIKLDSRCEIFQNLNFQLDEIDIKYKGTRSYLYNLKTGTSPVVVHGNGPIKPEFYRLANYLADGWTITNGCQSCDEDLIDLSKLKEADYPTVLIAVFVEVNTPFIREFFERVANLDYPKAKIDVYIHNAINTHDKDVFEFLDAHKYSYKGVRFIPSSEDVSNVLGRNRALDECISKECQYYFEINSFVQVTKPSLLKDLIQQNRTIIAPMIKRHEKLWSNFWGALSRDLFYARSADYLDIVNYDKVGVWNVPHVSSVLLVQGHRVPQLKNAYSFSPLYDADMAFGQAARNKGMFLYVTNRDTWGHLVFYDHYETEHLNNELFDVFNNPLDWENRYIHKEYYPTLQKESGFEQPCPDVYWFPIVTDTFCDEFVAELENFGMWSGGKNQDPRLASGYENVPTVDIHMNQVGLERQWLHLLQTYVRPLQEKVFTGYFHNPPQAIMNFIVRYKPEEQPVLRPHHDASTYTINIALNKVGVDYEGGGCRFLRYNCSVTATRKGWMMMHPGRLTHFHEGLRTTKGTRYIMISFVDP